MSISISDANASIVVACQHALESLWDVLLNIKRFLLNVLWALVDIHCLMSSVSSSSRCFLEVTVWSDETRIVILVIESWYSEAYGASSVSSSLDSVSIWVLRVLNDAFNLYTFVETKVERSIGLVAILILIGVRDLMILWNNLVNIKLICHLWE